MTISKEDYLKMTISILFSYRFFFFKFSSLGKLKKIEILSSIFSDHNAMRPDINYRGENNCKNTNTRRLNNILLNNQEITEKNQTGNFKKYLETNKKNMMIQNLGDSAKVVIWRNFIATQS